ncbi:hypothetical protein J4440_05360 [Candidatus Woesearchaeota archaeon]|nr:hypothetical protein [Candidatus Woesearchaeota archaeon]
MKPYIQQLETYEFDLVQRFRNNPSLLRAMNLSSHAFENILLQKRFLSKNFKTFYRNGIENIQDLELKAVAKKILAEEYVPKDHEILLDYDLRRMGFTPENSESTIITQGTIRSINQLTEVKDDVYLAAALRIFGELLVGEEYKLLFPELERRYVLTKESSQFFYPHLVHDHKSAHLGERGDSHTDQFSLILDRLIDSEKNLTCAKYAMKKSYDVRIFFWRQF